MQTMLPERSFVVRTAAVVLLAVLVAATVQAQGVTVGTATGDPARR